MEIYSQENSGSIPKNFNFLLKKAKGKYVTVIALDDMLLEDAISSKVEIMEQDENIQFVINSKSLTTNTQTLEQKEESLKIDELENVTVQDILYQDFNYIHSYYIQGSLYRKSIIEAVNYFDEDMIADDLVLRTKTAKYILENPKYSFKTLKTPAVNYRKHNSNISKNLALQLRSVAMFYQKYYPDKKHIRTLKNGLRSLLKQHKFNEAIQLYKEFPLYRDFTLLIPLWLIGIFLKDIFKKH